jgi:hypothetical protein
MSAARSAVVAGGVPMAGECQLLLALHAIVQSVEPMEPSFQGG